MKLFINIEKASKRKLVRLLKDLRRQGFKFNGDCNVKIKPRKEAKRVLSLLKVASKQDYRHFSTYVRNGHECQITSVTLVINFDIKQHKEFVKYSNSIPKVYKTANDIFCKNCNEYFWVILDCFGNIGASLWDIAKHLLSCLIIILGYPFMIYRQIRDYYKKH